MIGLRSFLSTIIRLRHEGRTSSRGRRAHAGSDRRFTRHRPCHGETLLQRRLAGDYLLAPRVSGELSLGGRTRRSHSGRSRRCGRHGESGRRSQITSEGWKAACAGQQCSDFTEGSEWREARRARQRCGNLAAGVRGQPFFHHLAGARFEGRFGEGTWCHRQSRRFPIPVAPERFVDKPPSS